MLQRIQSLYLLIVVIALSLMFFFPLAIFNLSDGNVYEFFIYGLATDGPTLHTAPFDWTSIVIISMLLLNSLVCIFLYKKRLLQIRMTILNIIMMAGSIFLLWYNISNQAQLAVADVRYMMPLIIPILSIVFSFLAFRAIRKDESLIKSMDRIR